MKATITIRQYDNGITIVDTDDEGNEVKLVSLDRNQIEVIATLDLDVDSHAILDDQGARRERMRSNRNNLKTVGTWFQYRTARTHGIGSQRLVAVH